MAMGTATGRIRVAAVQLACLASTIITTCTAAPPPINGNGGILAATVAAGTGLASAAAGETIADRLWLWSHPAGAFGSYFDGAPYDGWRSRITPVEAAVSMDIHNLIFLWENQPTTQCVRGDKNESCYPVTLDSRMPDSQSALTQYLIPFRAPFFKQAAFSVSGGSVVYPHNYTQAIFKVLPTLPGSAGVVFDDFVYPPEPARMKLFKESSQEMKAQGKDVFLCVYERELDNLTAFLKLASRPMLWTANVSAIVDMEKNWARLEAAMDLAGGRANFKPMLGIYMWDYLTNKTDIPHELMEHQLSVGLDLLRSGRVHDLIFLGSTIVDFDLRGVQRSREWIAAHKDEQL